MSMPYLNGWWESSEYQQKKEDIPQTPEKNRSSPSITEQSTSSKTSIEHSASRIFQQNLPELTSLKKQPIIEKVSVEIQTETPIFSSTKKGNERALHISCLAIALLIGFLIGNKLIKSPMATKKLEGIQNLH